MPDVKQKIENWREGSGYVGSFIHLADQAYLQDLVNGRTDFSTEERAELLATQEHVRETTRWFGKGLSAIGNLLIMANEVNSDDMVGLGGMIHELGDAINQLQDIEERISGALQGTNGARPQETQESQSPVH
ncbi:MAG: hypothetical protein GWM98_15600 [Nitrospinaceae bacterium]|nr:hypothetical protein [Nitrospinaceae bacterium]NIR55634.1 hypothetical protein [Nitrospinaceae bacterium]NIS86076.1 hypothetical protein [Nitrospinaceae bacterium]NIT82923.1 hypothetical protein [Nitrospinaceae bacterium]NIU45123.1 hypothetical protein [Nitrospinaceae bacterium]